MKARTCDVAVVGSYGVGLWIRAPKMPARGETVLGSGFAMGHGGKGSNQAVGVARLGVPCALLACVGADRFGAEALDLWRGEGVDASWVVSRSEGPTMAGFIILDEHGDNRIITDPGANALLTPDDVATFAPVLAASRVLLTQLEIPVATVAAALRTARRSGVTTILNPAPARPLPPEILGVADILTPNQTEARLLAGLAPDDPRPDEDVAARLFELGVGTVILTLGERGALILNREGAAHCPGQRVDVVDTTGAGDGFNAALAAALAEGRPLWEAVEWATHAGALVVAAPGVVPALPAREPLLASLQAPRAGPA